MVRGRASHVGTILATGEGLRLQYSRDPAAMPRERAEDLAVMAALATVK
jgi:hypothetical protein